MMNKLEFVNMLQEVKVKKTSKMCGEREWRLWWWGSV